MKPMLYVCNVSEDEMASGNAYVEKVREYADKEGSKVVVISAKIEEELSALDEEERQMFLQDLGVTQSGLDILIKEAYELDDSITAETPWGEAKDKVEEAQNAYIEKMQNATPAPTEEATEAPAEGEAEATEAPAEEKSAE